MTIDSQVLFADPRSYWRDFLAFAVGAAIIAAFGTASLAQSRWVESLLALGLTLCLALKAFLARGAQLASRVAPLLEFHDGFILYRRAYEADGVACRIDLAEIAKVMSFGRRQEKWSVVYPDGHAMQISLRYLSVADRERACQILRSLPQGEAAC